MTDKDMIVLYGMKGQDKTKWLLSDLVEYWNSRHDEKLFLTMKDRTQFLEGKL
jgi:hypothetical protein